MTELTHIGPNVREAARHAVGAVREWLGTELEHAWQRAKTEHDYAQCAELLDLLARPDAIAPGTEWFCFVSELLTQYDPEAEWYEQTHWWEVYVRADGIACEEYLNSATMIGASQSYILRARSTESETDARRAQLAAWRAGLDTALQAPRTLVNVGSRPYPGELTI